MNVPKTLDDMILILKQNEENSLKYYSPCLASGFYFKSIGINIIPKNKQDKYHFFFVIRKEHTKSMQVIELDPKHPKFGYVCLLLRYKQPHAWNWYKQYCEWRDKND